MVMECHQQVLNYQRIEKAIHFIRENYTLQPSLEEIAAHVHLSPFHFQRLFTEWAGTSPKQFLQFIRLGHAKHLLRTANASLFVASTELGLSGSGRLHDLFIRLEGMTPAEYKHGGKDLVIFYSEGATPFGNAFVANTSKGICHLSFCDQPLQGFQQLQEMFPQAELIEQRTSQQQQALQFFSYSSDPHQLKLHLKGTPFQLKVWQALLQIPSGNLQSYGELSKIIGQPNASRAVGTAIGSNPIGFLIPCHRVIRSTGHLGGYRWGEVRKVAMIGRETSFRSIYTS